MAHAYVTFSYFYRDCGTQSGTTTIRICIGHEKDTKSRFEVTFDGLAYHFYNKESNMFLCKGSAGSLNGELAIAQVKACIGNCKNKYNPRSVKMVSVCVCQTRKKTHCYAGSGNASYLGENCTI